jgi:hypothetical protein
MLTATDTHYLVGLLTKVTVPDDVEVELGDVKHKNPDGEIIVFRGIEVKDHLRPLTVEHIEQLCLKFNDMPEITRKAVVSASGYTKAAIAKAEAHNLELFMLIPWDDPSIGFNHVFAPTGNELLTEIIGNWVQPPGIAIKVSNEYWSLLKDADLNRLNVCTSDGSPVPAFSSGEALSSFIANYAAKEHTKNIAGTLKSETEDTYVKRIVEPTDSICIEHRGTIIPVIDFWIIGVIRYIKIKRKTEYKILIKHNETKPYVGCAITEITNGNLLGVTVNNETNKLDIIFISLTERQKKRISQTRL